MFLPVKRFSHIDSILLEADIIRFGDQLGDIFKEEPKEEEPSDKVGNWDNPNLWERFDTLIDSLLTRGIVNLETELNRPIYEKEFGSEKGKQIAENYLNYCKSRIESLKKQLSLELSEPEPDSVAIDEINKNIIVIAARIEVLQKIYEAFKMSQAEELVKIASVVEKEIIDIKQSLSEAYSEPIDKSAAVVKTELIKMSGTDRTEQEKDDSAKRIIAQFSVLDKATENYPPEIKNGVKDAKAKAEEKIREEIGDERLEDLKEEVMSNEHEAKILKRILDMRHANFTKEDQIYKEADQIKISINGLKGTHKRLKVNSRPEVITFLESQLAEVVDEILKKAREKNVSLEKVKGIHYDFEIRLKLHEITNLPVTGKQIADASIVMRLRKSLTKILGLFLYGGEIPKTAAYLAFSDLGQAIHRTYAVVLNSSAKLIGKTIRGREGEMKADAISRMFIPNPDVLDKSSEPINRPAIPMRMSEDASPGLAMQTPGSISGMGPIVAPTQTSYGSGDRFVGPVKSKKKKRRKKSVYEDHVKVLSFSSFISENK